MGGESVKREERVGFLGKMDGRVGFVGGGVWAARGPRGCGIGGGARGLCFGVRGRVVGWRLDGGCRPARPQCASVRGGMRMLAQGGEEGVAGAGRVVSPFEDAGVAAKVGADGETQTQLLQLSRTNVEAVLDEVRPFLQADGGNVRLQSIDGYGNIKLVLEGACGSCSSSSTTMQLGIEAKLRERFGDQLGEVEPVEDPDIEALRQGLITAPMVDRLLDEVRPAITGMGGSISVDMVHDRVISLTYSGPERLSKGIEMHLNDKIPNLAGVVFYPPDSDSDTD